MSRLIFKIKIGITLGIPYFFEVHDTSLTISVYRNFPSAVFDQSVQYCFPNLRSVSLHLLIPTVEIKGSKARKSVMLVLLDSTMLILAVTNIASCAWELYAVIVILLAA